VATGTVKFGLYSDSACTHQVFTSTNDVSSGLANSSVNQQLPLGTYYWTAAYSGDLQNQPSTNPCGTETLTVAVLPPAPTILAIRWMLGGTGFFDPAFSSVPLGAASLRYHAIITGDNVSVASGTVSFALYSTSNCFAGAQVFVSTNPVSAASNAIADSDVVPWEDYYNGDISYGAATTACADAIGIGGQRLIVTSPIGGPASSGGTTVALRLSCPVAVCRFRVSVTAALPLAADARHRGKRNPPVITLARGTVTIRRGDAQQVTLRLTSAGRRFVASHHGRVTATATIATTINGHTSVLKSRLTLRIAKPGKPKQH
jgi:hypothetical protein